MEISLKRLSDLASEGSPFCFWAEKALGWGGVLLKSQMLK